MRDALRGWVVYGLLFAALSPLLWISPPQASALSCALADSVEESFARYDGVAVGRVIAIVPGNETNELRIDISRSFKGVEFASLTVSENAFWGAYDGPSEVGEEYLFFLTRTDEGAWEHPLCAPSAKTSTAARELEALEELGDVPLVAEAERTETANGQDGGGAAAAGEGMPKVATGAAGKAAWLGAAAAGLLGLAVAIVVRRRRR